jgi:hypothetical protein
MGGQAAQLQEMMTFFKVGNSGSADAATRRMTSGKSS